MQGSNFQIDREPLLALPIFAPAVAVQTEIANQVRKLLECCEQLATCATSADEVQLNRVYRQMESTLQDSIENLYGFSDSEKIMLA